MVVSYETELDDLRKEFLAPIKGILSNGTDIESYVLIKNFYK